MRTNISAFVYVLTHLSLRNSVVRVPATSLSHIGVFLYHTHRITCNLKIQVSQSMGESEFSLELHPSETFNNLVSLGPSQI